MKEIFEQNQSEDQKIRVDEAFVSIEGDTRKLVAGGHVFRQGVDVKANFQDPGLSEYHWTFEKGGKENVALLGTKSDRVNGKRSLDENGKEESKVSTIVKMVPVKEFLSWQGIEVGKITLVRKESGAKEEEESEEELEEGTSR